MAALTFLILSYDSLNINHFTSISSPFSSANSTRFINLVFWPTLLHVFVTAAYNTAFLGKFAKWARRVLLWHHVVSPVVQLVPRHGSPNLACTERSYQCRDNLEWLSSVRSMPVTLQYRDSWWTFVASKFWQKETQNVMQETYQNIR